MVASISSGLSKWTDSVFSKLDTKNQGYIEKSDLQSALSGTDGSATQSSDIDDAFNALDGDGDGKVTKSELTDAMTKLSDQLNAQFDAARVNGGGGGMRPDGPPPGPPPGGAGGPDGAGSTDSTTASTTDTSSTTEPADTNGDGTVSAQEQAAYETKQASESDSGQAAKAHHEHDPMREFAHALKLLKAYADDSDTASSSNSSSVSVEA
jgi:hypothetical protein